MNTSSSASAKGSADFVKSANRLSGGERSYATVCLLLALWDTSSGTIACLDEWDVFLDNVNRQLAGNLLVRVIGQLELTKDGWSQGGER